MSRRSKKAVPKRQSENSAELLRRVKAKKRRRIILSVVFVAIILTGVTIAAVILDPPRALPGTLIVHIYNSAVYQPPCPSPLPTLATNATVTLNGPRSTTTPKVVGLIAYSQAPAGTYQVSATAPGYAPDSENVTVISGNTVHVCLALTKIG